MSKGIKFTIALVIVSLVIGYLLFTGLSEHSVYYLKVTELVDNYTEFQDKGIRLSGDVVPGSIKKPTISNKVISFRIIDTPDTGMGTGDLNSPSVIVEYSGVVPDAFTENVTVILEGKFDKSRKVFIASNLMAKCPSKYETEDPAGHIDAVGANENENN